MQEFWNDPFYKPKTVLHENFWVEFLRAARILHILDTNRRRKGDESVEEPTIYDVFNKLRQDMFDELPYSDAVIELADKEVANEIKKAKRKAEREEKERRKAVA